MTAEAVQNICSGT